MIPEDNQPIESMRKMPTQARSWRTILTIFEATAQILDRDGENALTTNRVAERAGFSIGTLYQYFPSLDAIILAMIDLERRRVMAVLERQLVDSEARGGDPRPVIRLFIGTMIDAFGTGNRARMALLKRAWRLDHTPPVIAATQYMSARIGLSIERHGHPDLPSPPPAQLFAVTRAVLGIIRAAVLEESPLPGTADFAKAVSDLAISFLTAARPGY